MAEDHPGPDSLTIRGIPTARRGLDRRAVEQMLETAAAEWAALRDEHALLVARIEHAGGLEYLAKDLGAVAAEIQAVIDAAVEAAHGMRTRAGRDSEERLREAAAAARQIVAEAEAQAFDLRETAWQASTELLEQVKATAARMIERAEADVLVIRAEAEQEAHRRVSAAKKDSDDLVRNARYEADRMVNEARAKADELLGEARRDAEAAQERTRALEARRKRLMADIDDARVSRLDAEGANAAATDGDDEEEEQEGTTTRLAGAGIRIIAPPSTRPRSPSDELGFDDLDPRHPGYGDALAEEVQRLGGTPPPVEATPPPEAASVGEPDAEEPDVPPSPDALTPDASTPAAPPPAGAPTGIGRPDPVGDLFARLRGTSGEHPAVEPIPAEAETDGGAPPPERTLAVDDAGSDGVAGSGPGAEPEAGIEPAAAPQSGGDGPDPLAIRDRLLLGVQNAGLRAVKDAVMEWQNAALDAIRVDGEWSPEARAIGSALTDVVEALASGAAEAGAGAAAELGGRPGSDLVASKRAVGLAPTMADDLVRKLTAALGRVADAGPRERSAELSRAFRAWRADQAERWVRSIAIAAYHDALVGALAASGVEEVVGVRHGVPCAECPTGRGSWPVDGDPPAGSLLPPAHLDCSCTIAPV